MDKPVVFISHITEEREMALEFKKLISDSFLNVFEVFVSSDDGSVSGGSKWMNEISKALEKSELELILCSPMSIKRPWINFEAGAGWVKNIPVIPVCHSGIEPSKLPIPLTLLEGGVITKKDCYEKIFNALARVIDAKIPNVELDDFIDRMKKLEQRYTFWDTVNYELQILHNDFNDIFEALKTGDVLIYLSETKIAKLEESAKILAKEGYLSMERTSAGHLGESGIEYEICISSTDKYKNLFSNEQCIYYKQS